jgi:hypothetical protein
MEPGRAEAPRSTWRQYLGCGCGGLVILAMGLVAIMTWVMYRQGKEMEATMKNPAKRAAKARGVLPWRELPPGYHPVGAFSLPFLMDMAIFSDREPPAGEAPRGASVGERGFVFIHMRGIGGMGARRGELQEFIEGKGGKPAWFQKSDLQLDTRDHIGHGAISSSGHEILYSANRGELSLDNEKRQGLVTFLLADCPGDEKIRLGIWFGPDVTQTAQPAQPADYAGTPADPEAIRQFAGHFQFCPAG